MPRAVTTTRARRSTSTASSAERAAGSEAGLRDPPALMVEGPEGAARRKARDERDGVEPLDPRRGPLYAAIALFVALLVFVMLTLIEMREVRGAIVP